MKKLALLSLLITLVSFGYSQSQRMVMLEHFTQASCGPCASANPIIHTTLMNNQDIMTSINFHTSWPGTDPMYTHNPNDPNARVTYYGVNAVPHSVIDGNVYSGHPTQQPGWTNMVVVNQRAEVPSPFTLSVNQQLSADNDSLYVTMLVEATDTCTGPISAFMGVIEKYIHFNSPPGSNGEKDFYNVLKKMLPTKTGIALPTPLYPGEYVIVESAWELANVYNLDQLSVVSYIQNPTTKEIHQAANLMTEPIMAVYDYDVEAMELQNMSDRYCENSLFPVIKIRNNGNIDLSALNIQYQLNDEEIQTYEWSGSMDFLDKLVIELPELAYTIQDTNVLKVYINQVNGNNDEFTANDTLTHVFYPAFQAGHEVQLKIRTDNAPEEITWEFKNEAGETIASGGPYEDAGTIYTEDISIEDIGCYKFFIYDAGGNGICCGNGVGFFKLYPPSGTPLIVQGTIFGDVVSAQFDVTNVSVKDIDLKANLIVYPNPAGDHFFMEVSASKDYKITVANQMGQTVYQSSFAGNKAEIETATWPNGLYFVRVESQDGISVQKLHILK